MITLPMRDVPVGWRFSMRKLSLGPIAWGAWCWTFYDGSTWTAIGFSDADRTDLIGWAALTMETDVLPVVGVFVREDCRKRGIGRTLVTNLLHFLISDGDLYPGAAVFASTQRWPKWAEVVESCGLRCLTWQ